MKLIWLKNGFICKELYAPFKTSKDIDYRNDLEKKYNKVMECASIHTEKRIFIFVQCKKITNNSSDKMIL